MVRDLGSALAGTSKFIKSIQEVSISATSAGATATITSVNTSNSVVMLNGVNISNSGTTLNTEDFSPYVELTDSTTVTATVQGGTSCTVKATVIEFEEGVVASIQTGSSTGNATISSVDTDKSVVFYNGSNFDRLFGVGDTFARWSTTAALLNSTTVETDGLSDTNSIITVYWTVLEFN